MKVSILGIEGTPAYIAALEVVSGTNNTLCSPTDAGCHIAVAPLLTTKLSNEEINRPMLGTLIFHPSPLPWGRGASSIKWAYRRREPITAATWFWANDKYDSGDICEQEILTIDYSLSPREYYNAHVIPALARTLTRALAAIERGHIRRIPQIERYSSHD
ncbi:MAG: formyltransferase family protein [Paludibacter sp.]|jgi:formyltetrahydrofolate dehydrogenase|nr:formyltransferase family protein [Paludibacter sp.]